MINLVEQCMAPHQKTVLGLCTQQNYTNVFINVFAVSLAKFHLFSILISKVGLLDNSRWIFVMRGGRGGRIGIVVVVVVVVAVFTVVAVVIVVFRNDT